MATVLTVTVAGERLALPAGAVTEILRPRPLARLPHAPASLLGLANLRGSPLPVVSLARLLGREDEAPSSATRVVVVEEKAARLGLLVDGVAALAGGAGAAPVDLAALLAQGFRSLPRRATTDGSAASAVPVAAVATDSLALLTFPIGGRDYALPLDKVAAVTTLPAEIAPLPQAEPAMLGSMAWRGGVLPLVALRLLLGLPAAVPDRRSRLVLVRLGAGLVGLVVDGRAALRSVPETAIDPVPPVLTRGTGEAQIEAICRLEDGRRLLPVLSPARLFDAATVTRLLAGAGQERTDMAGEAAQPGTVEQFLVFCLGEEHYGLPLAAVEEVVRPPPALTRLPHAPGFVAGVMGLRGRILPVIDQRQRFATPGEAAPRGRRILVVTIEGLRAGFAVDAVTGILAIPAAELAPVPEFAAEETPVVDRIATVARDGRMILLIDPRALLDRTERDLLAGLAEAAAGA